MAFVKGQSGNPGGRPKKAWTWAGLIRDALEEQTLDGEPMKKGAAAALVAKAMEGDVQALKEIGNRIDGMPKQSIDTEVKGQLELVVKDYTNDHLLTAETEGSDQSE